MTKETITIPLDEYNELCRSTALLQALQNAGVDNWDWYGDALDQFNEEYPE